MDFTEPSRMYLTIKRAIDLVGAVGALLVASPAILLAAIAIKVDSPGPIFFCQSRVGKGGREFVCYKFRSMVPVAGERAHREFIESQLQSAGPDDRAVHKLTDDKRITRVGKWLRRLSLDEVPQLFNVVKGQMSLVGPRPPMPYEVEKYGVEEMIKLQVKPGVTGLWQVSGRSHLTYRRMLELDVEYARTRSLWLDMRIIAKTIPAVLRFNEAL